MNEMNLEEKVKYLEEKVDKLEKIEKRRQRVKWIKIFLKIIFYVSIVVLLYIGYRYIKTNYLDPYDKWKNNIQTNVNSLKDYDYKSLFEGLFK